MFAISRERWTAAATNALRTGFGLPQGLARAVAGALATREEQRQTYGDPLGVVVAHMSSNEPPLIDPETFPEPEGHTEDFGG